MDASGGPHGRRTRQTTTDHNICLEVLRLMQESAHPISRLSENREVTSEIRFSYERALVIFQGEPLRRAFTGTHEDEFFIFAWLAQMPNVGARQSIAAHNSIARRTRPSALNSECAHAATQYQLSANHSRQ